MFSWVTIQFNGVIRNGLEGLSLVDGWLHINLDEHSLCIQQTNDDAQYHGHIYVI